MKLLIIISVIFTSCLSISNSKPVKVVSHKIKKEEVGKASWYSTSCNRGGTKTSSGKKLDNKAMTAAHKTLPFGTKVKVTNIKNGKSQVVIITDRGPYKKGRVIDVTKAAADKLGFKNSGIASVKLEVIGNQYLN